MSKTTEIEIWKIHFTLGILLLALTAALLYVAVTISPIFAVIAVFTCSWTLRELHAGWES